MTLKISLRPLLFGLFCFLPFSALAQQRDVTVYLNGGSSETGRLQDGPDGLYLKGNNGQYYQLAPGRNQINQDQQRIRALEQQNALLRHQIFQEEQQKLEIRNAEQAIETARRENARRQREEIIAEEQKHAQACFELLWQCRLPSHRGETCQSFKTSCKNINNLNFFTPISKVLAETDQFYPAGYLFPDGRVEGAYHQILGYVTPDDRNAAQIMAETAAENTHDRLPEDFPKSSQSHPYKTDSSEKEIFKKTTETRRTYCGTLLESALINMTPIFKENALTQSDILKNIPRFQAARGFLTRYNRACRPSVNIAQLLENHIQNINCLFYRNGSNLPALERIDLLDSCKADPFTLPFNKFPGNISDCDTLHLLCQVKRDDPLQEKTKACQTFQRGECLTLESAEIPNFFSPKLPFFWQTAKSAQTTMYTDYPSCRIGENAVIEAHGYFLGRISEDGFLTLYLHGKIFPKIVQFLPDGKLVKTSKSKKTPADSNPFEKEFFEKHFQRILPISGNGRLRECGRYNHKNEQDITNAVLILTPQGEIIKARYGLNDRALFAFEQADMQNMRQENQ